MTRLIYATLVGLVGAAVLHLAIVFLLPLMSANTAWSQIADRTVLGEPLRLGQRSGPQAPGTLPLSPDPFFVTMVCRYDLREGAFHVTSPAQVPLWTVGVHDSLGTVFFSANDRIVAGRRLDLAVVDAGQLRFVRQNAPAALSEAILAPADNLSGFVVIRAFRPDPTWTVVVERFVDGLECRSLSF